MLDLKKLTDLQLQNIGEMVLNEINLKLFNFVPTIHKAYQIYNELVQCGYSETDKVLACAKIKNFFKTRSVRHQRIEFYKIFGLPFTDEMKHLMTISFITCEIPADKIDEVAFKIHRILSKLAEFNKYEIDERVLIDTLIELYKPKYYENEWRITMPRFSEKLKRVLLRRGKGAYFMQVEETLYLIDPDPKKKKRANLQLLKEDDDSLADRKCLNVKSFKKIKCEHDLFAVVGPIGEFEVTELTKSNVIKDSELDFVKGVLKHINGDTVPEALNEDLYQNNARHPLVFNFLHLVKRYNQIFNDKEMSFKDAFYEIRTTVRAIREIGAEIVNVHEEVVGERIEKLNRDLKKAS